MKFAKKKDKRSDLQKEYDNAVLLLKTVPADSEAYSTQLKNVERLHKLLMEEKDRKIQVRVSPDAVLSCASNLLGMGLIMNFEVLHNISTKAFQLLPKGRLR